MFTSKVPKPFVLLQQAAYGIAGAATEQNKRPDHATPQVLADLLEEVFQCIADEKSVSKFMDLQAKYGMPIKKMQFAVMRMLCVLYREVRDLCAVMLCVLCRELCTVSALEAVYGYRYIVRDCYLST